MKSDGLDRFPLKGAELANHVPKKILPRLISGKAIMKSRVESLQFGDETFDVHLLNRELWDRVESLIVSNLGEHEQSPFCKISMQNYRSPEIRNPLGRLRKPKFRTMRKLAF